MNNRPKDSMETSVFLQKVKNKWGENYTFDIDSPYIERNKPLACHCEKHNIINYVNPRHFIEKGTYYCGCTECNKDSRKKKNKDIYITNFIKRWGDGYSFDNLEYVDFKHSGIITCKEHGDFMLDEVRYALDPNNNSIPCPICNENNKKEIRNNKYLKQLKEIYGDTYIWITKDFGDYFKDKVEFICPTHGKVSQTLCVLLNTNDEDNYACPKCKKDRSNLKLSYTLEEALNKAKTLECCKYYDFSMITEWFGVKHKYTFRCTKHNDFFEQTFDSLFSNNGNGCKKCNSEYMHNIEATTKEEFNQKSNEVHGNIYDYSKVNYVNTKTKVCIICPKHGEFWQRPQEHLRGSGCPKCHRSKLEEKVCVYLDKKNSEYKQEVSVKKLTNIIGPGGKSQRIDIYIPNKKICIECQGIQHFTYNINNMCSPTKERFNEIIKYDAYKYDSLVNNGYDVIYYFPKKFLEYSKNEWYLDKKCFHELNDLYEYINNK